ncbi:hypothetical protein GCM10009000_063960 [Halobacterium noricense]|uniref:Uncharacterized protein n=1 Tax=Haladaptatus pallidirubidus TaxID=1008152 RepID=A0AAV3UI66_9EURY
MVVRTVTDWTHIAVHDFVAVDFDPFLIYCVKYRRGKPPRLRCFSGSPKNEPYSHRQI